MPLNPGGLAVKQILSVSLGSSNRDHTVQAEILGERFNISRIGTHGNFDRAQELLGESDGTVDAIGLGGIDIYLYAGNKRYEMADGRRLADAARKTPVVDGSGLKDTLERSTIEFLADCGPFQIAGKKVLMVCAVDRFGMAEAFTALGCDMVFGDLIFALDLPVPVRSLEKLTGLAEELLPKICNGPFDALYPTGAKQDEAPLDRCASYYHDADIIAGDFHYIRRYMPASLEGKAIITNTTTPSDVDELRRRGVTWLVTSTPRLGGRSFGTNVLEASLITLIGKDWRDVQRSDYLELINTLDLKPAVQRLN